jgi:hypothetical protein
VYALILNGEVGIAQSFGLVLLYFLYVLVVGLGRVIYKCEQIATLRLNVCDPIVMCNLAFPSLASHPQPHRTHSPHSNSCSNNSSTTHHSPLCTLPSPLTTRTHTLLLPHHVIFRPPFVSVCSPLFPRACVRASIDALSLWIPCVHYSSLSRVCVCALWQIGLFPTQRPTPTEHVHGGDNAAVLVKAEGARRQPGLSQGQPRVRESMAPCLIAAAELG